MFLKLFKFNVIQFRHISLLFAFLYSSVLYFYVKRVRRVTSTQFHLHLNDNQPRCISTVSIEPRDFPPFRSLANARRFWYFIFLRPAEPPAESVELRAPGESCYWMQRCRWHRILTTRYYSRVSYCRGHLQRRGIFFWLFTWTNITSSKLSNRL